MSRNTNESDISNNSEYHLFDNCIVSKNSLLSHVLWDSGQMYIGQLNEDNCCNGIGLMFLPFCGFLISTFRDGKAHGFSLLKEPNASFSFMELNKGVINGARYRFCSETRKTFREDYKNGLLEKKTALLNSLLEKESHQGLYEQLDHLTNKFIDLVFSAKEQVIITNKKVTFIGQIKDNQPNGFGIQFKENREIEVGFYLGNQGFESSFFKRFAFNGNISMSGFVCDLAWPKELEFDYKKKCSFYSSKLLKKKQMIKTSNSPFNFGHFIFDFQKIDMGKMDISVVKIDSAIDENLVMFHRNYIQDLRNNFRNYPNLFKNDKIINHSDIFLHSYLIPIPKEFLVQLANISNGFGMGLFSPNVNSQFNSNDYSRRKSARALFVQYSKGSLNNKDWPVGSKLMKPQRKSMSINSFIHDFAKPIKRSSFIDPSSFADNLNNPCFSQMNLTKKSNFNRQYGLSLSNLSSMQSSSLKTDKDVQAHELMYPRGTCKVLSNFKKKESLKDLTDKIIQRKSGLSYFCSNNAYNQLIHQINGNEENLITSVGETHTLLKRNSAFVLKSSQRLSRKSVNNITQLKHRLSTNRCSRLEINLIPCQNFTDSVMNTENGTPTCHDGRDNDNKKNGLNNNQQYFQAFFKDVNLGELNELKNSEYDCDSNSSRIPNMLNEDDSNPVKDTEAVKCNHVN